MDPTGRREGTAIEFHTRFSVFLAASLLVAACTQEAERPSGAEEATSPAASEESESGDRTSGFGEEGLALFEERCAACHLGSVPRAPHFISMESSRPETILAAMDGIMSQQAEGLSDEQRILLAEFLSQKTLGASSTAAPVLMCAAGAPEFDYNAPPAHHGWGLAPGNTRFVPGDVAKLPAEQVPNLTLKWAFAYPNATRARSQPTIAGGAVFVASHDNMIFALDIETGCARWTFKTETEVRHATSISSWTPGDTSTEPSLYFGDSGRLYRLNAVTGALIWKVLVDEHKEIRITGTPKLYNGRIYVPLSSREWASASDPAYECCTFQGGVAALDAETGEEIWKTRTISDAPRLTGELNDAGARTWHPAGAPVWNSPTIDPKRGRLYVGTGEAYTAPAASTSDSILAMNLETGAIEWVYQALAGDAWNMSCIVEVKSNCPVDHGPDMDFGAPPILTTLPDGRQILLAGQKAGVVYALDPDNKGELLWKRRTGIGGYAGGVHWGMAADGGTLFVPNADTYYFGEPRGVPKPGLWSLDAATGEPKWFTPAPNVCSEDLKPACDPGLSAAITAIPGIVFAGGLDGMLRAHGAETGTVVWEFNALQDFETINGDIAEGGAFETDGPVVAYGKVFVNSGYPADSKMAGNVLLVFEAPASSSDTE